MKNQYKFKGDYTSVFYGNYEVDTDIVVTINLENKSIDLDIDSVEVDDDIGMSEKEFFTLSINDVKHQFNIDIENTQDITPKDREKLLSLVEKIHLLDNTKSPQQTAKTKKF